MPLAESLEIIFLSAGKLNLMCCLHNLLYIHLRFIVLHTIQPDLMRKKNIQPERKQQQYSYKKGMWNSTGGIYYSKGD